MAAVRSRKQATRGGGRPGWPSWVWFGSGLLVGFVAAAVLLASDWAPMLRKRNLPQPNPGAQAARDSEPALADEARGKDGKPRKSFDFYQVLPEMEVVIPDSELSAKARAEQQARNAQATQPAQTPTTPAATPPPAAAEVRYMLQAGSYPEAKAADEVKARLALLGFSAQVQPVVVNGKTWNRVRVGPYPNASELEAAKRALADNGINAVALKETR